MNVLLVNRKAIAPLNRTRKIPDIFDDALRDPTSGVAHCSNWICFSIQETGLHAWLM